MGKNVPKHQPDWNVHGIQQDRPSNPERSMDDLNAWRRHVSNLRLEHGFTTKKWSRMMSMDLLDGKLGTMVLSPE
jgi:hypothetical protein